MKPFVKWAGGKKQLLPFIQKKIQDSTYLNKKNFTLIEPFVGGGVVFLSQKHKKVIINDLNSELMVSYRVIRNNPEVLMKKLDDMYENFLNDKENYYLKIRAQDREDNYSTTSDENIAARFIFLNKTCFNGLYRVNSEGFFNTPMGRNKLKQLYDKKNINALSNYLKKIPETNILNGSYKNAMKKASVGDVVYVDPPYAYEEHDGFTKYQKEGFSLDDLKELKDECDRCLANEAYVIISNNDTKEVRAVFDNGLNFNYSFYYVDKIDSKRMINCRGHLRNTGKEIIIWGTPRAFPKISDISKLIEYLRIRDIQKLKNENSLSSHFEVSRLRVSLVLESLQYFGLIDILGNLTDKGILIRKTSNKDKNNIMKKIILEKELFQEIYHLHNELDNQKKPIKSIFELLLLSNPKLSHDEVKKRAKIVKNIMDWCLTN